jgi:hypothetical protein
VDAAVGVAAQLTAGPRQEDAIEEELLQEKADRDQWPACAGFQRPSSSECAVSTVLCKIRAASVHVPACYILRAQESPVSDVVARFCSSNHGVGVDEGDAIVGYVTDRLLTEAVGAGRRASAGRSDRSPHPRRTAPRSAREAPDRSPAFLVSSGAGFLLMWGIAGRRPKRAAISSAKRSRSWTKPMTAKRRRLSIRDVSASGR